MTIISEGANRMSYDSYMYTDSSNVIYHCRQLKCATMKLICSIRLDTGVE